MVELYLLLGVVIVFAAIVLGLLYLALRRLKARRAQLLNDLNSPPRLMSDRAFNRLAMARRETDILGRQGVDTVRARELIAQSQAAFDQSQFSRSYELAQSAHEALVNSRQTGTLPSTAAAAPPGPAPARPAPALPSRPGGPVGASPPPDDAGAPVPRLAPNRAESQFEMRLLDSDLDRARSARASPSMVSTATSLRTQAQTAFDAGQYTDALRFALKGRRELGGKVETLAAGPGTSAAGSGPALGRPDPASSDPTVAAERAAGGSRCSQCGYPTRSDDAFCRGCGRPLAPSNCPQCGAVRSPADTFCGRCGAPFS